MEWKVIEQYKDATKMVMKAEEGVKLNEKEKRLAKVMVTTKSNLARNMAAEFMKTRGDYENMKKDEEAKNEAKVAKIEDNINRASRQEIKTRKQFRLKSTEVCKHFLQRYRYRV